MTEYEVYRELFAVTEWRDGAVYKAESRGTGWFPLSVVEGNRPRESSLLYVAASDAFSRENMTIRVARGQG